MLRIPDAASLDAARCKGGNGESTAGECANAGSFVDSVRDPKVPRRLSPGRAARRAEEWYSSLRALLASIAATRAADDDVPRRTGERAIAAGSTDDSAASQEFSHCCAAAVQSVSTESRDLEVVPRVRARPTLVHHDST